MVDQEKLFAGCFIKFGALEHLIDLREKGLLYCNPIQYFTTLEDQFLRGDDLENAVNLHYMESGTVMLSPVGEKPSSESTTLPFRDARLTSRIVEPFGNLFCLYAINVLSKPMGHTFTVSGRVKEFGEYFLLISDSASFLNKVRQAVDAYKLVASANMVEYKDFSKFTGPKTVFQKDLKYEYQKEWRLYIKNDKPDPIKLEIGSLEDISILGTCENIEQLMIRGKSKDDTTVSILSNLIKNQGD